MKTALVFLLIGLLCQFELGQTKKILFVSFFSSKSHNIVYEPILLGLANKGHALTVVSPVKGTPHKNIKEINGMGMDEWAEKVDFIMDMFEMRLKKQRMDPFTMGPMFEVICRSYYEMPEVIALQNEHWDLVLVSAFMNECTFGLLPHLKAPFIIISTISPIQWTSAVTGTPSPASFVPLCFLGYNHKMNFIERAGNLLGQMAMQTYIEYVYNPQMEKIYREFLGEETPSLYEIQKNVSMIIASSHFSLSHPRPLMPDIVEVGGLHCHPAKPLPKELDDFLTGSGKDGFIYFSMGSIVKPQDMPEKFRKILVSAFSKVKQRVLWKWNTEEMDDLPKNVKLSKWLPQQDVLGHPNIKMFITHGGLGSTVEAVYHGVPLIGIPMYGDQDSNMRQSELNGFALTLEFGELTEEYILNAINIMLTDQTYTKRVKELSAIYRDRPRQPLDDALYWTEYVMKHNGATHLRSPARDLNWVQYHSIDVIAFVTAVLFLAIYLGFVILRLVCRRLCGSSKKVVSRKKRN